MTQCLFPSHSANRAFLLGTGGTPPVVLGGWLTGFSPCEECPGCFLGFLTIATFSCTFTIHSHERAGEKKNPFPRIAFGSCVCGLQL